MIGIIFLIITVLYFIADRTGHARLPDKARRIVYIILSVLPFIAVSAVILRYYEPKSITEMTGLYDMDHYASAAGAVLAGIGAALVNSVFCIVGFIAAGKNIDASQSTELLDLASVMSCICAALMAASTILFAAAAFSWAGSVIYKFVMIIAAGIGFGILTFGVGFILMALFAIFYLPFMGIESLSACAPLFALSGTAMLLFCVFHMITACAGIIAVRRLRSDSFSAGKAAAMSILCCLPLVNIPVLLCLAKDRKNSRFSLI